MQKLTKACRIGRLVLLLTLLPHFAGGSVAESPQNEPAEPEVTAAEAALLEKAAEMAPESASQAALMLRRASDAESSPALDFSAAVYAAQSNDLNSAIQSLETALDKMPHFHRARFYLGQVLMRHGSYERAARELRKLLNTAFAQNTELWNTLANLYATENQHDAAETAARQALLRDPDNRRAKLTIIRALVAQGRVAETKSLIKELLAKNPREAQLWRSLAQASLKEDEHTEALIMLECSKRLGLATTDTLASLGDLYLQEQIPDPAADIYLNLASRENAPVKRVLRGANALIQTNQLDQARRLVKAMQNRKGALNNEELSELRITAARLHWTAGDKNAAAEAYRQVVRDNPLEGEAIMRLAEFQLKANNLMKAENLFRRASRLEKFRARAFIGLARVYLARREYKKAVKSLENSLAVDKNSQVEAFLKEVRKLAD